METQHLIPASEFCVHHNIEFSFISSLQRSGLIEITTIEEKHFIDADRLELAEKFVKFYRDLDINIEGIEAVTHLLERVKEMQAEIISLKNKLRLYESIL